MNIRYNKNCYEADKIKDQLPKKLMQHKQKGI